MDRGDGRSIKFAFKGLGRAGDSMVLLREIFVVIDLTGLYSILQEKVGIVRL